MRNLKLLMVIPEIVRPSRMLSVSRVNALLLNVPRVQLASGKNQYLLMLINIHGQSRFGRTIVRGDAEKSHEVIFEETKAKMDEIGICTNSLGGGFIENTEKEKLIQIYGCCKTFGEAPHGRTKDILLSWTKYQNYNIVLPTK